MRYEDIETDTSARDFIPRSRAKSIWKVILGFAAALVLMLVITLVMPDSVGGVTEASLISLIAVSLLCFYIVYLKQQNLDLVMATEFQNLLFAQAAALGYDFCLFVKRDGIIIYASPGLNRMFPNMRESASQALEGLFKAANIEVKNQEKVMSAIYANESDRLIFPITTENGKTQDYIIAVDPLERPHGYTAVRGRKFVTKLQRDDALLAKKAN